MAEKKFIYFVKMRKRLPNGERLFIIFECKYATQEILLDALEHGPVVGFALWTEHDYNNVYQIIDRRIQTLELREIAYVALPRATYYDG